MNNKLIPIVLTLVVGIILAGSVLMPVLNDASTTERTFKNEGYYTMDKLDSTTEAIITWEKSNLNIVTVNGIEVDMSQYVGTNRTSFTLIGGENGIFRYEKTSSTFAGIQGYGPDGNYASFHSNSDATAGDKVTLTVSGGSVVVTTDGTSPLNRTFSDMEGYIINPSGLGEYAVMKRADIPAYVHGDSEIHLIGVSVSSGPNAIAIYGEGTVNDGISLSTVYKPAGVTTVSYSDAVATDSVASEYIDLYELEKYVFTITYDTNTYDATYSYFLVPVSVTAELTQHLTPGQIALMGAIPVLVIVALLVVVVGVVARRND